MSNGCTCRQCPPTDHTILELGAWCLRGSRMCLSTLHTESEPPDGRQILLRNAAAASLSVQNCRSGMQEHRDAGASLYTYSSDEASEDVQGSAHRRPWPMRRRRAVPPAHGPTAAAVPKPTG